MISGRGGAGAGNRGRIRPPRRIISAKDATDMDEAWHMLEEALHDIHSKTSGRLSFEELYRAAYKMVIKKKGAVLYERVKQFEEQWFATHVIPKIDKMVRKMLYNHDMESSWTSANERRRRGETFLTGLRDIWHDHNTSMNMMADILMYLDRGYSQQQPNQLPIFATTIALFRDRILRCNINDGSDTLVMDLLIRIMLEQIDMEREGDVIDRNLIRGCSQMLTCLYEDRDERADKTLYLTIFQPRFLANSRKFYERECQRLLQEADVSSWLRHTQRRLVEEADRCGTTIERETLPHTQVVIEQTLISSHLQEFLAMETSGVKWMIDNDKTEDLSMLYGLITRVDQNKTALQTILHRRVIELGIEIEKVLEKADASAAATAQVDEAASEGDRAKTLTPAAQQTAVAIKWVDDVMRFKEKFDGLLSQCFHGDLTMQTALTKSFSDFINLFRRSSEYVSLYIDDSLKRGIRGKTESEVDAVLDKVIVLMCYLQDRDLFQTYYQRHLARRLLHGKSESQDVEKAIISRMKQELGHQFTSKFEGMFRDLVTSSELTSTYHTHMTAVGDGSAVIELSVKVLTTNFWPPETMGRQSSIGDGSRIACVLPREIQRLQASFEQFYLANRNGRKLTWIASTGSADVRCTFPAIPGKTGTLARERRYELHVPTFSMTVLMLFNDIEDGTSLSFEEIQVKTGIATADLMRALTAIAVAPKSRVLLKEPATKSVKPGDAFAFNSAFQSKAVRIKAPIINGVSKIEDRQERRTEKNDQTRAHIIDAAVVRIMKSRKTLSHGKLVSEVIEQLSSRFKPDVLLIKRRIEDLIVREYLERPEDEEVPSTYRYVA